MGRDSRTKDGRTKEKLSLCVRSWSAGSENCQAIKSNKREFYDIVYFYGVRYQRIPSLRIITSCSFSLSVISLPYIHSFFIYVS